MSSVNQSQLQKDDLQSELLRFEQSYVELLRQTSIEITKLKSFIGVLRNIDSKTDIASISSDSQNLYSPPIEAQEFGIYYHSEPMDSKYIEQRIEILRESKLALIKLTSFEMNRLRDIIKKVMNNMEGITSCVHSHTASISSIESAANIPLKSTSISTDIEPDEYDIAHPLVLTPLKSSSSVRFNTKQKKLFRWAEIEKHNKRDNLWVVYHNKIYDVTTFLPFHPGGVDVILDLTQRNQDITNALSQLNHPPIVQSIMIQHHIGDVYDTKDAPHVVKKRKDSFSTLQPVWDSVQHNLNVRLSDGVYAEKDLLIAWRDDIYSVKVDILDKQHEDLVNIINDLYNTFELRDALQLLHRWDVHCKTEEALFFYFKIDEKTQANHVSDHKKMYYAIKDEITGLRIKYNHEKRACHELIHFAQQFAEMFKRHHFKYDAQYIDCLDI